MKEFEPTSTEENFAITLADNCKTHVEWLSVVRFGLKTLLENQLLLIEIITREAERQAQKTPGHTTADEVRQIFHELNLRLMVAQGQ